MLFNFCFVFAFFVIAGKSNLMDAISFVLGEKTTNLRVKKLSVSNQWFSNFDNVMVVVIR